MIIVPNSLHCYGVVMPTACVSLSISYVTVLLRHNNCLFMIIIFVISNLADSFSDTPYGLTYNSYYLSLLDVQSILIHRSHVIAS